MKVQRYNTETICFTFTRAEYLEENGVCYQAHLWAFDHGYSNREFRWHADYSTVEVRYHIYSGRVDDEVDVERYVRKS